MEFGAVRRFWPKVEKTASCWIWQGATNPQGYGNFGVGDRVVKAHRFSYELHKGQIPDGLELDHICRIRPCVNPDHLELVTHAENSRRRTAVRTSDRCVRGHLYTLENTVVINRSDNGCPKRCCKACWRIQFHLRKVANQGGIDEIADPIRDQTAAPPPVGGPSSVLGFLPILMLTTRFFWEVIR